MKKLMHSLDHVDDFTKNLRLKRNKQFFERVRNTEAYYHPQDWELDYQKQVYNYLLISLINYLINSFINSFIFMIIVRRSKVYETSYL